MDRRVAGATNFQRRTWDKDEFERRAKERAAQEAAEAEAAAAAADAAPGTAAAAKPAEVYPAGPAGLARPAGSQRAYLQGRDASQLHLEDKLGKRQLVTDATPVAQVGGYYCQVCECTLRDSSTYLDHINGKPHQRKMGFTMRVERVGVDAVKARLAAARGGGTGISAVTVSGTTTIDAYDRAAAEAMNVGKAERRPAGEAGEGHTSRASRMGEAAAEAKTGGSRPPPSYGYDGPGAQSQYGGYGSERGSHPDARRSRSRSGERKPEARGSREEGHAYAEKVPQPTPAVAEVAAEEEEEADEMAAMLGFSDFGGSKKR